MPKPKSFKNPEQPDKLFGHPCKVKTFDNSKMIEVIFNGIKVSDVPFKESDLPLAPEESTFSYNNKNWILLDVKSSDKPRIGDGQCYGTYKIIAIDKDSCLR